MPRSPSRDRSDRYTGHRGYFRCATAIGRGKALLSILGLYAAVSWGLADAIWPKELQVAHTHGELADPHAPWASNCEACHRPLNSGSNLSPFAAGARWQDFNCERCHAGPAHHPPHADSPNAGADAAFHNNCGNCHHDHQGRSASLVRLADSHCTRCHGQLDGHAAAKHAYPDGPPLQTRVTSFTKDHPDFRGLDAPPESRTLKFSHALHMTPGIVRMPNAKGEFTPKRMTELKLHDAVERYRDYIKDGVVQLDCRACHQLDAGAGEKSFDALKAALAARGEPAKNVLPARAAGAHFLPVNFEASCRACHPVQAPPVETNEKKVIAAPHGFPLPHRRTWNEIRDEATAGYLKRMLDDNHPLLVAPPEPGGRTDGERKVQAQAIRAEAERLAGHAMAKLGTDKDGCRKCHDLRNDREIVPLPNRTTWLPSARFDHTAHRATKCLDCHPGTAAAFAPGGELIERESVKANIRGLDSCKACHTPAVGVRHGCTDCHSYHNGGHPLQGRGATNRAPAVPLDLADFLRK